MKGNKIFVRSVLASVMFLLIVFRGIPLVLTIINSFRQYTSNNEFIYVGINNYISLLNDSTFYLMLKNSLFLLLYIPANLIVSIILSIIIYENRPNIMVKMIIYFPKLLPAYIVGVVFSFVFGYSGLFNQVINFFGNESIYIFNTRGASLTIIALVLLWTNFGWQTIMLLSRLDSLNKDILDLSKIDGLNFFRRLFIIYIPELSTGIILNAMMSVIFSFGSFYTIIYVYTKAFL